MGRIEIEHNDHRTVMYKNKLFLIYSRGKVIPMWEKIPIVFKMRKEILYFLYLSIKAEISKTPIKARQLANPPIKDISFSLSEYFVKSSFKIVPYKLK